MVELELRWKRSGGGICVVEELEEELEWCRNWSGRGAGAGGEIGVEEELERRRNWGVEKLNSRWSWSGHGIGVEGDLNVAARCEQLLFRNCFSEVPAQNPYG